MEPTELYQRDARLLSCLCGGYNGRDMEEKEHVEAGWIDPQELSVLDTVPGLKETWERVACSKRSLEE